MKNNSIKIENESNLANEREQKLQRDLEEAKTQRNDLINEIEEIRKHKADMLEPQLIAASKELKVNFILTINERSPTKP